METIAVNHSQSEWKAVEWVHLQLSQKGYLYNMLPHGSENIVEEEAERLHETESGSMAWDCVSAREGTRMKPQQHGCWNKT